MKEAGAAMKEVDDVGGESGLTGEVKSVAAKGRAA
jgi:hypothetical protein